MGYSTSVTGVYILLQEVFPLYTDYSYFGFMTNILRYL